MKIQVASDFHIENEENSAYLEQHLPTPTGDVLVLAGDIFVLGKESVHFEQFIDWCSKSFEHTFIVPGNHEYYGGVDIATTLTHWELPLRHNVRFINNKSIVIDDVEFFFTTLWSQVPADAQAIANKYMPECSLAQFEGQSFDASKYTHLHNMCRAWLDNAIKESTAAHKIVVTHHCPVEVEDPRYESNGLSRAFVNPMEDYVKSSGVDAWIFGHTHYNGACGTKLGNTVLLTNQLGYAAKGVCNRYNDACVINIPNCQE